MKSVEDKLRNCYKSVRAKTDFKPEVALVLGSGLGDYADQIRIVDIISYHAIDGFPVSTVAGHKGQFIFGYVGEVPIVAMQGRVHYYEGYRMQDVVLPIRLMGLLGAKKIILTNASGGLQDDMKAGDLMLITDHITGFVPSPLIGVNIDSLGERFPDMSEVYDKTLRRQVKAAAKSCGVPLKKGVYIQLTGPNYETPAEVQLCKILGADAVGMSTAVEAMAAKHMGMQVCGISCICNPAAGLSKAPLSHKEVQKAARKSAQDFTRLVTAVIGAIGAAE